MSVTDCTKSSTIVEKVLITRFKVPIYGIHLICHIISILVAQFATIHLLSVVQEWKALRNKYSRLGKFHHPDSLGLRCFRGCYFKSVPETVVIVAAGIADVLKRLCGPGRNAGIRMTYTSHKSENHIRYIALNSAHEPGIGTVERATQSVPYIVTEGSDAVQLRDIVLERQFICRIGRGHCSPTFAVEDDIRGNCVKTLADIVHSSYVVNSHKIEAEAVYMVLSHPPLERFGHKFAEHSLLRGRLIATA